MNVSEYHFVFLEECCEVYKHEMNQEIQKKTILLSTSIKVLCSFRWHCPFSVLSYSSSNTIGKDIKLVAIV
jgi:hypothetical protein